ncbi:uncharacterized protein LOC132551774 isoform X2 [Ylistrum balloti]|uniref:uncharacterized protein LOC132551774 isoform X2 n=1 Tax=Ylistrum balloti TaxID=509963 RepID=UPI002905A045|nr:uncharacterized protein LOC132551774 isoform X2 [Ylistrum balloti]
MIARQLSYQREFLSPTSIRVTIPGGLPYEAFEARGSKVTPWSLLHLFESTRAFSFWPMPAAERPEGSFADFNQLLMDNFFFIATANLSIERQLYDEFTPKFPLSVTIHLDFVGRSSFLLTSSLAHMDTEPYAVCKVQSVLVNSTTRKPTPFPDWWRRKYLHNTCLSGTALKMKDLLEAKIDQCYQHDVIVYPRECDSYFHTNWSNYVRYCSDTVSFGVLHKKFKNITEKTLEHGIKELEISLLRESNVGDKLNIVSWETNDGLNFRILKDSHACAQMSMSFFQDIFCSTT